MDGLVVKAAQKALQIEDVHLVLVWSRRVMNLRFDGPFKRLWLDKSPESKELTDRYFYETLVQIHRAGEGTPYTA